MTQEKKKRKRYSDNFRAEAMAALAANGGNVGRTARQLSVPIKTLEHWAKGHRHPEAAKEGQQKRGPMADRLEEIAWQLIEAMPDKIAKAPLNQLAVSTGIAIDKMRLLREQATAIDKYEGISGLTDDELDRKLTDVEGRIAAAEARKTEANGSE